MRHAMKSTLVSLAMLASVAVIQRANAADLGYNRSPANGYTPAMVNWGGAYGGVHIGYAAGHARNANLGGVLGGAQLGFNVQSGAMVVGIEGDLSLSNVDYHGFADAFRQKWSGTLRGRVGYAYDRFLPFFTLGAGFTSAQMKSGGAKADNTHGGFVLGLGAEYKFTEKLSGSLMYLHRRDGAQTYNVLPVRNTTIVNNEIRIGVNYHF